MSRSGPRYIVLLCALLAVVAAGGCGKKGPLYLPDDAGASGKTGGQVTMPAPAQPPK